MAFLDELKKLLKGGQKKAQDALVNWALNNPAINSQLLKMPTTTLNRGSFSVQAPNVPKMLTQAPGVRDIISQDAKWSKNPVYKAATAIPRFLGEGMLDMGRQAWDAGANVPLTLANQSSSTGQKAKELALGTGVPMAALYGSSRLANKLIPNKMINSVIPTIRGPVVVGMNSIKRQLLRSAGQGAIENVAFNIGSQSGKGTMEGKGIKEILGNIATSTPQAAAAGAVLSPILKSLELNKLGKDMFNTPKWQTAASEFTLRDVDKPSTPQAGVGKLNHTPLKPGMIEMLSRKSKPYMETVPIDGEFTPLDKNRLADVYAGRRPGAAFETVPLEGETGIVPARPPTSETGVVQKPPQPIEQAGIPPSTPQLEGPAEPPIEPPKSHGAFIDSITAGLHKLYTQTVNRFHPLTQLGERTGRRRAVEEALTGYYGSGTIANSHIDNGLKPIVSELDKNGITRDQFNGAITAMRDISFKSRGLDIKSNMGDPMTNLKDIESQLGPEKMKALGETMTKMYEWYNKVIQKYMVDTGVIGKDEWAKMRADDPFYIPFKRVMDKMDEMLGVPPKRGAGSVSSQNVIYGIGEGSERKIVDPLESMIENIYKAVSLGKRQNIAKEVYTSGKRFPNEFHEIHGTLGDNTPTISFFENGKKRTFKVPIDIAEAAKGYSEESIATWIKLAGMPATAVRLTATQLNPEFLGPNILRDLPAAYVNAGLNPLKFISGMMHLIKKDEVYQKFLEYGGRTSRMSMDQPFLKQSADSLFSKSGVSIKSAKDLGQILINIADYSEQPTRIAVFEKTFKEALGSGMDEQRAGQAAAFAAQEATINFARRGSKLVSLNYMIPFLNAHIQGTDKLLRTLFYGEKADRKAAFWRLGLITQIPAIVSSLNNTRFKSFNDPRLLSEQDKRDNYIWMLSDTPMDLPGPLNGLQYIKIPKGQIGKFANPTEKAIAFFNSEDSSGNLILEIAKQWMSPEELISTLSPIDNEGDLIPAALKPFAENRSNYNYFRGTSIVPEYAKAFPAGYQASQYTPEFYKALGPKLVTPWTPQGVSPAQLENVGAGFFTGMEKLAMPALDKLAPTIAGGNVSPTIKKGSDINRVPIMRRFLGGEKKSEEEYELEQSKKTKALDFKISDLKSGVKKGYLPANVANEEITKLLDQKVQQSGIVGKEYPAVPQTMEELLQKKLIDSEKESIIKDFIKRPVPIQKSIQDLLSRGFTRQEIRNVELKELKSSEVEDKAMVISSMLQKGQTTISELYGANVLTSSVAQEMERQGLIEDADSLMKKMKLTDTYYQRSQIRKLQTSSVKKMLTKQKAAMKKALKGTTFKMPKLKNYKIAKMKTPKMKKIKPYKFKFKKLKL